MRIHRRSAVITAAVWFWLASVSTHAQPLTGDDATGEDVEGRVEIPARQTGSPMTYMHGGKQNIVLAVSHAGASAGGELIAYALP